MNRTAATSRMIDPYNIAYGSSGRGEEEASDDTSIGEIDHGDGERAVKAPKRANSGTLSMLSGSLSRLLNSSLSSADLCTSDLLSQEGSVHTVGVTDSEYVIKQNHQNKDNSDNVGHSSSRLRRLWKGGGLPQIPTNAAPHHVPHQQHNVHPADEDRVSKSPTTGRNTNNDRVHWKDDLEKDTTVKKTTLRPPSCPSSPVKEEAEKNTFGGSNRTVARSGPQKKTRKSSTIVSSRSFHTPRKMCGNKKKRIVLKTNSCSASEQGSKFKLWWAEQLKQHSEHQLQHQDKQEDQQNRLSLSTPTINLTLSGEEGGKETKNTESSPLARKHPEKREEKDTKGKAKVSSTSKVEKKQSPRGGSSRGGGRGLSVAKSEHHHRHRSKSRTKKQQPSQATTLASEGPRSCTEVEDKSDSESFNETVRYDEKTGMVIIEVKEVGIEIEDKKDEDKHAGVQRSQWNKDITSRRGGETPPPRAQSRGWATAGAARQHQRPVLERSDSKAIRPSNRSVERNRSLSRGRVGRTSSSSRGSTLKSEAEPQQTTERKHLHHSHHHQKRATPTNKHPNRLRKEISARHRTTDDRGENGGSCTLQKSLSDKVKEVGITIEQLEHLRKLGLNITEDKST